MKQLPEALIGKRIEGAVLREHRDLRRRPRCQLILCFDDGTSFEFWCGEDEIHPAGGFDKYSVDTVQSYMGDVMKVVRQIPAQGDFGGSGADG
ncbi:MAG: hypothetical protein P1U64_11790 [Alcanivoracaceae bacterium]|nr:hypothetical protein [Alcanivoracaceae bacterium]